MIIYNIDNIIIGGRRMYNDSIMVKLPRELKDKLKEEASLNCQNMSDYVRALIVKDLKEKE